MFVGYLMILLRYVQKKYGYRMRRRVEEWLAAQMV